MGNSRTQQKQEKHIGEVWKIFLMEGADPVILEDGTDKQAAEIGIHVYWHLWYPLVISKIWSLWYFETEKSRWWRKICRS